MAVKKGILLALFAVVCLLASPAIAAAALPTSHITETVQAVYYPNGTQSSFSSRGTVEVSVGNIEDVMQYLILNLSKTNSTNLLSRTAFKSVAASPSSPAGKTRLFLNTTDRPDDIEYNVSNMSLAPVMYISMDYRNKAGGRDIYSGSTNNFSMDITFNTTSSINGVDMAFQAAMDTVPANYDSMDIYFANASSGTVAILSADQDAFMDRVNWTGNMVAGTQYTIHIESTITPGFNFDEFYLSVPMGGSCGVNRTQSSTFTGITFSDRFSRGPIREGIELTESIGGGWDVRGIMRNIASGLEYVVHGWDIYEVGNSNPLASSSSSSVLNSSDVLYTSTYNSNKKYFATSFDWEVIWGSSVYRGITEGSVIMPSLYEINSFLDTTVLVQSNDAGGTSLFIRDMVQHLGHSSVKVNDAFFHSVIPNVSTDSTQRSWSPSNVTVYYANNTGWYDITGMVTVSTKSSGPSSDGYVDVNITNVTSIIGRGLMQNERFYVTYGLSSGSMASNYNYVFGHDTTIYTSSGTPMSSSSQTTFTVAGTAPPPPVVPPEAGPPGAGEVPPSYYIDIVKEFAELTFITPFLVEIDTSFLVSDTGTKGAKDVSITVLVPGDGTMETDRMGLSIYRKATDSIESLVLDGDYEMIDKGVQDFGEEKYREYLIRKISRTDEIYTEGWTLADGDKINLKYRSKVPFGTHSILTRVSGYDYYRDITVIEDAYLMFRRELELKKFIVDEGTFVQEKAIVNEPVTWTKRIHVTNPNEAEIEDIIESAVFPDTLSVYYITDNGERKNLELESNKETFVSWKAKMGPNETRTYFLSVITPPILETDRVADILDANKTLARIMINSTLENFARENYTNISFFFEGRNLEVIEVQGGGYTLHNDSIEIHVPDMAPGQKRSIIIVYKEIPPILILILDKARYKRGEDVQGTILFVPGESTSGGYLEYEIAGPSHKSEAVYLDVISTPGLSAGNETKVIRAMATWNKYSGKYTAYAKYRKEFATILSAEKGFEIETPELPAIPLNPWILVIIAIAIIIYLIVRIHRRRTYREEVGELREEVKKL